MENKLFFEISWEIANKIGGIYTVIRSKAAITAEEMGHEYFLIGPYNHTYASTEVEVIETNVPYINEAISKLRINGIKVVFGRWLIEGYPRVILFDIDSAYHNIDGWRHEFFEKTKISIHPFDKECNDVLVFGSLTSWFLTEVRASFHYRSVIISHFHEWQSGIGLIFLKTRNIDVSLIFTTHATILGRYLCAGKSDFYNHMHIFNLDEEAGKRLIYNKYCIERAASHCSHVFTTVSTITSEEAFNLIGRKPDVLTYNGLNVRKYAAKHEFQTLHAASKEKIKKFVQGHFFGNIDFDIEKTLYIFSAGRYEVTNKGIDMFLDSLAALNNLLKFSDSDVTIVAFLIFPARTNNFNVESLKGQALIKQTKDTVANIQDGIGNKIFDVLIRGRIPESKDLITSADIIRLKRCLITSQRDVLPPICTHNMLDDANDPILNHLRHLQLFNNKYDRVKVIFFPEFLTSTNPLFPIDYEDFVRGCHLGVFPSYYEPWGYTPAECTVMGIPSVTTNVSGFGAFISDHVTHPTNYGIYIVDRRFRSFNESAKQLADFMFSFAKQTQKERIMQRNRTERLSDLLDWKSLGKYYQRARYLAVERTHPDKLNCLANISVLMNGDTPRYSRSISMVSSPASPNDTDDELDTPL